MKISKELKLFCSACVIGAMMSGACLGAAGAAGPGVPPPPAPPAVVPPPPPPAALAPQQRALPNQNVVFGLINGGINVEQARILAVMGHPAARQQIDELTEALNKLEGDWAIGTVKKLDKGLGLEEVVYEILNWPAPNSIDRALIVGLSPSARHYLVTPLAQIIPALSPKEISRAQMEILKSIPLAAKNIEGAKIADMKAQRRALEDAFNKISKVEEKMLKDLNVLNESIRQAYDLAQGQDPAYTKHVRVFTAKIVALNTFATKLSEAVRGLSGLGFSDYYNSAFKDIVRQYRLDEAKFGGRKAERFYYKMAGKSRFIDSAADQAIKTTRVFTETLRGRFMEFCREFQEIINDKQADEKLVIDTCVELAKIADEHASSFASDAFSPLRLFVNAGIFEMINGNPRFGNDQAFKEELYRQLPDNVKPGAANLDYANDREHRHYAIPAPSAGNHYWNPVDMAQLVIQ